MIQSGWRSLFIQPYGVYRATFFLCGQTGLNSLADGEAIVIYISIVHTSKSAVAVKPMTTRDN